MSRIESNGDRYVQMMEKRSETSESLRKQDVAKQERVRDRDIDRQEMKAREKQERISEAERSRIQSKAENKGANVDKMA